MPRIINYTKHPVRVFDRRTRKLEEEFKPSGFNARINVKHELVRKIGNIEIKEVVDWTAEDVPPEGKEDALYVVSHHFKSMFPNRKDLLVPIEQLRNKNGRVYGCLSLCSKLVLEIDSYYNEDCSEFQYKEAA